MLSAVQHWHKNSFVLGFQNGKHKNVTIFFGLDFLGNEMF